MFLSFGGWWWVCSQNDVSRRLKLSDRVSLCFFLQIRFQTTFYFRQEDFLFFQVSFFLKKSNSLASVLVQSLEKALPFFSSLCVCVALETKTQLTFQKLNKVSSFTKKQWIFKCYYDFNFSCDCLCSLQRIDFESPGREIYIGFEVMNCQIQNYRFGFSVDVST